MMDLRHAAQLLGGDVSAGRILAPGPGHSRRDRSLSVRFSSDAPDGFLVTSFASDDWQSCKDHVRQALGLDRFRADTHSPKRVSQPVPAPCSEEETQNRARALTIWGESVPISGTPAESYLASRSVPYFGHALRWHPRCPFGRGVRVGCMVALVQNVITNEPQAIHRTAIDQSGNKLSHLGSNGRLTLAPIRGGAVKLTADEDVTTALGIGEGIESVLSMPIVADVPGLPVWSLLSAGPLSDFPVLPGIEALWIAVDHDDAGIRACRAATARWMTADRPVTHAASETPGQDLNDLLREVA